MENFHNIFHSYVQYHPMIFQWYSNAIIQQDFTALMMWKKQQSSWNVIIFNIPMGQWNFASNGVFKGSCVLDQLEPGLRARPNWLSHWLSQTLRWRTRTWQRFLNWGYPNGWMVYFMENLFFLSGMVLGVPHFRKPPYQLHYDLFVLIFTYSWWLMSLDIGVCSERSTSDSYVFTKEMCFSARHFNSL